MEEDELLPGIDGTTFQIQLGEEFRPDAEVLHQPVELELDGITLTALGEVGNEHLRRMAQQLDETATERGIRIHQELENHIQDRANAEVGIPIQYIVGHDLYTRDGDGGAVGIIRQRRVDNGEMVTEYVGRPTPAEEDMQRRLERRAEGVQILDIQREGRINRAEVGIERDRDQVGRYDAYGRPIDETETTVERAQMINLGARRYGGTTRANEIIDAWNEAEIRRQYPVEPQDAYPAPNIPENEGIYHRVRREEGDANRPQATITADMLRNAMGVVYERPTAGLTAHGEEILNIHPRNIRGVKNYTIEFLEKLRIRNEINGEVFEKIVEHLNDF